MAKCGACGKFLKGGVVCSQCKSQSHHECVRIPVGAKVADVWRCGECQSKTPKGRDPSTPVRVAQDIYTVVEPPTNKSEEPMALDETALCVAADSSGMEFQRLLRTLREELFTELKSFKEDVHTLCSEMREFRLEMADFRVSLAGVSARLDCFEERLEAVEQRRAGPAVEVAELERTVTQLKIELNERDQEALQSDLEIGHLPEEKGESVLHAVTVLAAKLGVTLEERDVVFAERVGVAQGAGAGVEAPRERRVVVRLARRYLRDQLLQAARVRRTLTAADAGRANAANSGPRIFLNERLTRVNRQLFHRVRDECRRLQWRFSWTKRGRIYARQADGKPAYPIRSEADLSRVFGSNPV